MKYVYLFLLSVFLLYLIMCWLGALAITYAEVRMSEEDL